jgi:hypothetical protein
MPVLQGYNSDCYRGCDRKFQAGRGHFGYLGLTRTEVVAPNGVFVSYLRPTPQQTTVVFVTSKPLPSTTLTNAEKNAILVPLADPTAEQLTSLYEIWFSNANTQRFNIENRFDDLAAGSTGFVSNVSYPKPPPTGKEIVEGKGAVEGKQIQQAAPTPLQATPKNRLGAMGYRLRRLC